MRLIAFVFCFSICQTGFTDIIRVGPNRAIKSIQSAIQQALKGDTIIIENGVYREGTIVVNKPIHLIGEGLPVLDGQKKFEVLSITSDDVFIRGLKIKSSGNASLDDPGGIKVYDSKNVIIEENHLYDNFFGIYLQHSINCRVENNIIEAFGIQEQEIGNGIHAWKCSDLVIKGNRISGHRDGIYFEFVTNSVIWRNVALNNIRYGLHFMFSNNDAYISNLFRNNGAGVAVMFTKNVTMLNNTFDQNWGDAAYGLLLKEISDCYLSGNRFSKNTTAIFLDGTNRITAERNVFKNNGWGMKVQANCMDNIIRDSNFIGNTFDVSTNGSIYNNTFSNNYWDRYSGYDLDKNGIGDVPYRPLSLFSVIVETRPAAMLLFRSFMVTLLDKSEKLIPSLTPDNFMDESPRMKPLNL